MAIPTGDKTAGQAGHVSDHNAITDALRDHDTRIGDLETTPNLPAQSGHAGEFLSTDGTDAAWGVPARLYATDGVNTSEVVADSGGTVVIDAVGGIELTGDEHGATYLNLADVGMEVASDTAEAAGGFTFTKSRGSIASPTAVQDGDIVAYQVYAEAHDGTNAVQVAQSTIVVDGTVATGKVPTTLIVATADADGVVTERIRHSADGTTDVTGSLTVNGAPVGGGGGGSSTGGDLYLYENYT